MKKTKIIATIGPASESEKTLKKMFAAGVNVARLNFSHGDYKEHLSRIKLIRKINKEDNYNVAILLDTKGPEIRTLNFKDGQAKLLKGSKVIVTPKNIKGTSEIIPVSYKKIANDVNVGGTILLDDGLISLKILSKNDDELECKVRNTGIIKNKKGVNLPKTKVNFKFMSSKDKNDIEFACDHNLDYIAASFVRDANDVKEIRKILKSKKNNHIQIISKIECEAAVENIDEIIEVSDAIMIARGDLGVEVDAEDVPFFQKRIIKKCLVAGIPTITATQMLESMQINPRPTRAEVTDVANAILDGSDAIMLSGETAAGLYPVESVKMQSKIAIATEDSVLDTVALKRIKELYPVEKLSESTTDVLAINSVYISNQINDIKLIIAATKSGHTAKSIAKFRPDKKILAITNDEQTSRSLSLVWGVKAVVANQKYSSIEEMIEIAIKKAKKEKTIKKGDKVLLVAGELKKTGTPDMLKIVEVF